MHFRRTSKWSPYRINSISASDIIQKSLCYTLIHWITEKFSKPRFHKSNHIFSRRFFRENCFPSHAGRWWNWVSVPFWLFIISTIYIRPSSFFIYFPKQAHIICPVLKIVAPNLFTCHLCFQWIVTCETFLPCVFLFWYSSFMKY